MEQILQIVHILDGKGIVEAQFFCGGSQLLRCGPGAAHLVAGLEGSTRDTKNVSVTTPRRTRILLSNRFMIYFVILKLPPVGLASVQIDADRSLGI